MKYYIVMLVWLTSLLIQTSSNHASAFFSRQKNPPVQSQLTTQALRAAFTGEIINWNDEKIQQAFREGPNCFGTSILHVARNIQTAQAILYPLDHEQRRTLFIHTNCNAQNVFHVHCCHDCPDLLDYLASLAQEFGILDQLVHAQDVPYHDTPLHKATASRQAQNIAALMYWQAQDNVLNHDRRQPETPEMIAQRLEWLEEYTQARDAGLLKRQKKEQEKELESYYTPQRLRAIVNTLIT